jgi:hypothetical protein
MCGGRSRAAMGCCWRTCLFADRLTCCRTMRPEPWRPGCANVPAPKSSPEPDPTPESKPGERQGSYRAGPDRWERTRALRAQGWSIQAIGREVSLSPKTARRLLHRATPPSQEYMRHLHVPRLVEPFLLYLLQRWADGCRNGPQLTREIERLGHLGKGSAARWMIARRRPAKTRGQPKRGLLGWRTRRAREGYSASTGLPCRCSVRGS